jgi:hypothetical protein
MHGEPRLARACLELMHPHDPDPHGVIDALEDAEDYAAFEMAVAADYDAQSAVERELVLSDSARVDGTRRKLLDVSRLTKLGWRAPTLLEDSLWLAY